MAAKAAAEIFVEGHVQGVGYRNYAQRRAALLGLVGWVMNTRDGRVRVRAEGPRDEHRRAGAGAGERPAALPRVDRVDVRMAAHRPVATLASTSASRSSNRETSARRAKQLPGGSHARPAEHRGRRRRAARRAVHRQRAAHVRGRQGRYARGDRASLQRQRGGAGQNQPPAERDGQAQGRSEADDSLREHSRGVSGGVCDGTSRAGARRAWGHARRPVRGRRRG